MKGKLALFVVVVLAAFALWYLSGRVKANAENDNAFMALYEAARAVRAAQPVYEPSPQPVEPPPAPTDTDAEIPPDDLPEAAPNTPVVADSAGPDEPAPKPQTPDSAAFIYAPYVAVMLAPLALADSPAAAALMWYWFNVALLVVALLLSVFVLSGRFILAKRGMCIVPLFAALPFVALYLPSASLAAAALVFVLAGLGLFRRKLDILAGLVSSLAVFSPLGVAFGAYFFLKRSWKAGIAFLVGVCILVGAVPVVAFGVRGGYEQTQAYYRTAIMPYVAGVPSLGRMHAPDNQSVWAVIMRHTSRISEFGKLAASRVPEVYNVNFVQLTSDWMAVLLVAVGSALLLVSVFAVWRKIPDREIPLIGFEGALVVLAVLLLRPYTYLDSMVLMIFPLCAVVYVVRMTDLSRPVHHVSYVGLVLAGAFFYLALDPRFKALGSAFAGALVLWIAMLSAINRFRPHIVQGRATAMFGPGKPDVLEKPVEIAKPRKKLWRKKEEEQTSGLLPMPDFALKNEQAPEATPKLPLDIYEPLPQEEETAPLDIEIEDSEGEKKIADSEAEGKKEDTEGDSDSASKGPI